jgi:hypothetical protein
MQQQTIRIRIFRDFEVERILTIFEYYTTSISVVLVSDKEQDQG